MSQIGKAFGRTKDSICGRVHRLGLPARPSPLKPKPLFAKPRRAPRKTLKPLATELVMAQAPTTAASPIMAPPAPQPVAEPAPVFQPRRSHPCSWVVDDTPKRQRSCDEPTKPGRSFCPEHDAIAYPSHSARQERELKALERLR